MATLALDPFDAPPSDAPPPPAFPPIRVTPDVERVDLLLTALSPISHHDAAEQDDSNTLLFNRQKQLLPRREIPGAPSQDAVDALLARHAAPSEVADLLREAASFPEFVAVALVRLWLDLYNSYDGAGLFTGVERYERLESRLRHAAVGAATLPHWWNRLCREMQVGPHASEHDAAVLHLLATPAVIQQLTLRALADQYRAVLALARYWHGVRKKQNPEYAAATGQNALITDNVRLEYDAAALGAGGEEARVVEVPAVTANSVRSVCVRKPAWRHLAARLGIVETEPGKGEVPAGVEAIFWNGGNIRAGAKQPSNPFGLAAEIRRAYPSLDLLGGVTDSFDLGEGRLKVGCWLVCRENRAALQGTPAFDLPEATVSAFDLLDDVTLTRQATAAGLGQMIFSFSTLCPGTRLLVRLALSPETRVETRGALYSAIDTYLGGIPTVGGSSARGFGHVAGEIVADTGGAVRREEMRRAYEAYLAEHRAALREGLTSGRLGTSSLTLS